LMHDSEELIPTATEGLMLVEPRQSDFAALSLAIDQMKELIRDQDSVAAVKLLAKLAPDYRP
ncbi:MAG: hypothetical protein ORO03_08270, partial [Alphaproteobacteria bacterium]|nr:hypothetical protein [Alphaproteobacteria bacterium]